MFAITLPEPNIMKWETEIATFVASSAHNTSGVTIIDAKDEGLLLGLLVVVGILAVFGIVVAALYVFACDLGGLVIGLCTTPVALSPSPTPSTPLAAPSPSLAALSPSLSAIPTAAMMMKKKKKTKTPVLNSRVKITVAGKYNGRLGRISQVAAKGATYWTVLLDDDFRGPTKTTRKAITSFTVIESES